jgi:glycosyltransferase involved in cell wall biosynthesis
MKINKKLKIVFLINSYTHYNNDLFISLKKIYDIKVLLISSNEKLTKYKYFDKKIYLVLKKIKIEFTSLLTKLKPDIVIIGGYKISYTDFVIKYVKSQNIKYFFWLEKINFNFILKEFFFNIMYKDKLKKVDGIFAVGKYATKFYKKFNTNVYNIPYSISLEKRIKNYKNPNFLFVGQIIKRKGIQNLLNCIKNINTAFCKFTFVGSGPLVKNIKKIIKLKKNVFYYNFKNKDELNKIYEKCNILILPSAYDGWGVVIIEAMARAMSVISNNNVGASNEYIKHNLNGRISDKKNNLENQIKFYINNKDKIKIHGKKNRIIFEKNLCHSKNLVKKVNLIFSKLKINGI